MGELIILFVLYVLNVLACLFNAGLAIYYSIIKSFSSSDKELFHVSFAFSIFVIVCDVAFIAHIW